MSYVFDPGTVSTGVSGTDSSSEAERPKVPEKEWRQFDFGMDCLIPTEDYALPKEYDASDD